MELICHQGFLEGAQRNIVLASVHLGQAWIPMAAPIWILPQPLYRVARDWSHLHPSSINKPVRLTRGQLCLSRLTLKVSRALLVPLLCFTGSLWAVAEPWVGRGTEKGCLAFVLE